MRLPARANTAKRPVSVTRSVSAPVQGWNARDALADMEPLDAITLDNFFPTPSTVALRGGYADHVTGLPGEVETLMEYASPSVARKLIAASENAFYDVTTAGAVGAAMESGHTSSRWQHVNFGTSGGHFIVAVNGADGPRSYDGSAWATLTITGSGLTDSNLIHVMAHQRRLFYIEKSTLSFWYLTTPAAISGAATEFDLASLCTKGGELMAAGSWSVDSGEGMDDLAVFITSAGQAVVYAGTDPSSANTWALQGIYDIGKPIGRRCLVKMGSDLVVITEDGFVQLSAALAAGRSTPVAISDKIFNAVNDVSRAHGSKFGWQAILYPRGKMLLFNIPITELGTSHQYVMNTSTGSWCRFKGQNAFCWALLSEDLYFGGNTKVYKADDGSDDGGANVDGTVKPAFNYFGAPGVQKRFTQCRPIFVAGGGLTPAVVLNVDFEDSAVIGSPSVSGATGATWDVDPWDTSDWGAEGAVTKNWIGVNGIGYAGTLKVNAASNQFGLALAAIDYMFEPGGPM